MTDLWARVKWWVVPVLWVSVGAAMTTYFYVAVSAERFTATNAFQIPPTYLGTQQKISGTVSEGASLLVHGRKAGYYYVSATFAIDAKQFAAVARKADQR